MEQSIRVAVRIRPEEKSPGFTAFAGSSSSSSSSSASSSSSCVDVQSASSALKISKKKEGGGSESFDFTFDNVWGTDSSQSDVFDQVKQLIDESLNGFSVTIFAFGMTGSGKTHTIAGTPSDPGIVPRAVSHIFSDLQRTLSTDSCAMVFLTYVELYNNVLYDLLAHELPGEESSGLRLHEHPKKGVTITGSPSIRTPVCSAEEAMQLISRGNKLRATSSTNLNERSSRSHTVISFEIVSQDSSSSSAKIGKINLVDLAGSERVKLSGAEGQALEEAKQINKALSVLGDVLNSLSKYHQSNAGAGAKAEAATATATAECKTTDGATSTSLTAACTSTATVAPHIPYRNSKLTMLLKDSLGGNAKTMMIATIRQSSAFYHQSLLSLRYAARARHIKCNPVQNVAIIGGDDPHAMHETLQQVNRLQSLLETRTTEFGELKARLRELEEQGGPGDSTRLEKEKQYKEQIETLRKRSAKEREELQDHVRCVIRNHAGALAAKDRECGTMEDQLVQQSNQIRSLSRDRQMALRTAEQAEMASKKLLEQVTDRDRLLAQLQVEKAGLERQLTGVSGRLSAAAEGTTEREQLVDALQKVTESRNKHKKRAEEVQGAVQRLTKDVDQRDAEIKRLKDEHATALQRTQNTQAQAQAQAQAQQALSQAQTEARKQAEGGTSAHLQLQLESLQLQLQQLQGQHRIQLELLEQTKIELLQARSELDSVQRGRDNVQSRLHAVESENVALLASVRALQASIEEAQKAQKEAERTQQEMTSTQHAVVERLAVADTQVQQLLAEKDRWGGDKATLKGQIKALSGELKDSLRREAETRCASDTRLAEVHAVAAGWEAKAQSLEQEMGGLIERREVGVDVDVDVDVDAASTTPRRGMHPVGGAAGGSAGGSAGGLSTAAGAALALEIELSLGRGSSDRHVAQTSAITATTIATGNGNGKEIAVSDVQSQTSPLPPSHTHSHGTAVGDDQQRENELLKSRISQLVSQERDMFATLTQRLGELDEARTKLLRLKTAAAAATSSGVFERVEGTEGPEGQVTYRASDGTDLVDATHDQPPPPSVSSSAAGVLSHPHLPHPADCKGRLGALEIELKHCKDENKRLRRDVEKHKKHLALERKLSQSYLSDLEQARIETAFEVTKTVAVMRERVAGYQSRRHTDLANYLESLPGSANASFSFSAGYRSRAGSLGTEDEEVITEGRFVGGEGDEGEGGMVGECLWEGGIASLPKACTGNVSVLPAGKGKIGCSSNTGSSRDEEGEAQGAKENRINWPSSVANQ